MKEISKKQSMEIFLTWMLRTVVSLAIIWAYFYADFSKISEVTGYVVMAYFVGVTAIMTLVGSVAFITVYLQEMKNDKSGTKKQG